MLKQTIIRSLGMLGIILIYLQAIPVVAQEKADAKVNLTFSEEEGVHYITAKATTLQGEPIAWLDLYFFVDRTFSQLPFGDTFNTTEEDGTVTVEFPKELPGDQNGNVTIHVKILESDDYNDLDVITTKKWGVPIAIEDHEEEQRSLWAAAANAPISLIILVTAMVFAVWFIICYILFKLYTISRIKPTEEPV